jgi:hypothetical protein
MLKGSLIEPILVVRKVQICSLMMPVLSTGRQKKLIMKEKQIVPKPLASEPQEEFTDCRYCNAIMLTRDGEEPTEICDHCAHERVAELEAENAELRAEVERLRCRRETQRWIPIPMHLSHFVLPKGAETCRSYRLPALPAETEEKP